MKGVYVLKQQDDEIINITEVNSYEEALQYFCERKKLNEKDLLKIYKIEFIKK